MSEDFVDVTWRGLEVVKKARLRGTGARTAYVEHPTPMPTGSQLVIRTAEGHELAAMVARVQEQIGGRSEPPGMEVTIEATGAAATWWLERAEAAVAAIASAPPEVAEVLPRAARQTMIMTPTQLPGTEPPVMPVVAIETGPTRPSHRASAVTMPPPVQGPPTTLPPPSVEDARITDPMISVEAVEAAAEAEDNGDAIPTGIDDSVDRPGDSLIVDDGRRTMIMPAIDIEAIVEASSRPDGTDDKKKPKGKKRRGR